MTPDRLKTHLFKKSRVSQNLPRRRTTDNKVTSGKVVIVAGSSGLWGAATLSAQAASRCGAGYVYLLRALPGNPDFLTIPLYKVLQTRFSACVLGPGYRHPRQIESVFSGWLKAHQPNVVLDAEALNWLSRKKNSPRCLDTWVLTPHEGEMARLLNMSSRWVKNNRERATVEAQKKYGGVVLLKGPQTLISDGKTLYRIPTGNPGLGKAGSGDVLSGMIAAFLAQKKKSQKTVTMVCLAAYVHGWLADQWLRDGKDILSLRPVDLLDALPLGLKRLRKSLKAAL